MQRFWEPVIKPLLAATRPRVIVEVGADRGGNTHRLVDWCRAHGAQLHVIDPCPHFDVEAWRAANEDVGILHVDLSLNALDKIPAPDTVLIDGDHNYYTVLNELRMLGRCRSSGTCFPIVLLHDIHWPYGRRDLYYNPETIPAAQRKPYRQLGLRPNEGQPVVEGGFNSHLCNGIYENSLDNGVLTAVEAFRRETNERLSFTAIPGLHGLGILSPESLSARPRLMVLLSELEFNHRQRAVLEATESDRLTRLVDLAEAKSAKERAEALKEEARRCLDDTEQKVSLLSREVDTLKRDMEEKVAKRAEQIAGDASLWRKRAERAEREVERIRGRRVVKVGLRVANGVGSVRRGLVQRSSQKGGRLAVIGGRLPFYGKEAAAEGARSTVVEGAVGPSGVLAAQANIVIPVHNALRDVKTCLVSLEDHTNLGAHKLILVDDGSDLPTQKLLQQAAARLDAVLIRREDAGGFSVAANTGIERSWLPYVVLLNSDTVVGPWWVERLIMCAQSDPTIGIVGPWSNAASWQSIPALVDQEGKWSTNPQITSDDANWINERLVMNGARLYPRVPLVNGFCYMVTRTLLDRVGSLDVESFPRGYGEEDDLSIRASKAGFSAAIADDCFVYHAKARSYTATQRDAISRTSQERLLAKHGQSAVRSRTQRMRYEPALVRARSHASGLISRSSSKEGIPSGGPTVGWLQPHLRVVGGIRRAIEMTNRLVLAGWDTSLIPLEEGYENWLPVLANRLTASEAQKKHFDILIVSDPDVVPYLSEISCDRVIVYHLDAYFRYRQTGINAYHALAVKCPNLANSRWTADTVSAEIGISVADVVPGGVDPRQFAPRPVVPDLDVVCYGSNRNRKCTPVVVEATRGMRLGKLVEMSKSQSDLSWQFSRGKLFASASAQEGFNLPCLEAMACGVPVVMTDDGGSRDYVENERNAIVVQAGDGEGLRTGIERVLRDDRLRGQLIEGGLATSARFDWNQVTSRFARVLIDLYGGG